MKKYRVAFYGLKYYPSRGGSSRLAEGLARELSTNYDITIYCYRDQRSKENIEGVRVVQMPKLPFGQVGIFLYYLACCLHIVFSRKYNLIHVHKTDSALFIPLLALRCKVIATSQEAPYLRDKWNAIGKLYFRLMERIFISSNAALTSVSKPLAEYYMSKYNRKVVFIPNGVELSSERNDFAARELLDQHGVKETTPFLLFAARRIMSTKGCHTLLQALHHLNFDGPVVVAGEESHAAAYVQKIRKLSHGLNIKFVGYVGDKPTLMSLVESAQFFVFPSETEGLSLMLLEVASTGKTPLICSDIAENTQVFTDQEVLFFEDKSAENLAQQLRWALDHPHQMSILATRAQQRVIEDFSSRVVASQYEDAYQAILRDDKTVEVI